MYTLFHPTTTHSYVCIIKCTVYRPFQFTVVIHCLLLSFRLHECFHIVISCSSLSIFKQFFPSHSCLAFVFRCHMNVVVHFVSGSQCAEEKSTAFPCICVSVTHMDKCTNYYPRHAYNPIRWDMMVPFRCAHASLRNSFLCHCKRVCAWTILADTYIGCVYCIRVMCMLHVRNYTIGLRLEYINNNNQQQLQKETFGKRRRIRRNRERISSLYGTQHWHLITICRLVIK